MKNRLVATLYLLLTMGLVGVSVSPQASARTTKRKTVRAKTTKRVVPPQPKPTTTTAVSTGNNDDATKAAIMAVYNRFVEIDVEANLHPENGPDAYRELLLEQAFEDYAGIIAAYKRLGAYCDCPLSAVETLDPKITISTQNTAEMRFCSRITGPVRIRSTNEPIKSYPVVSISDQILKFSYDVTAKTWKIYFTAHLEDNGRNSTCANGK